MPCIQELLSRGKSLLASKGIDTAALDSALLLAKALDLSRERLYTETRPPEEESITRFFEYIRRRSGGEPAAYILGCREFWGMGFAVNPAVLVPRPDTEILVEAALEFLRDRPGKPRILDLCTGSGAVVIALGSSIPAAGLWAADISGPALETARENAARFLLQKAVFLAGDLFDALKNTGAPAFSLITANAPYVPSGDIASLAPEVRHEPWIALDGGPDGLDVIRRIVAQAPDYLEAGGGLFLEADPSQTKTITALMESRGFRETAVYKDLAGLDRVAGGFL